MVWRQIREHKSDGKVQKHVAQRGPEQDAWRAASCCISIQEALLGKQPNLIWEH